VADAHAHVERLVSVVKMATVLEAYTTEEQRSVVRVVGRRTQCKGYSKRNAFCGKCMSPKAVHNLVENFSQGRSKVADN
jgi:hypothetical protein